MAIKAREIQGKPSTPRVAKRFQELLDSDLYIDSQRIRLFTDYMKDWTSKSRVPLDWVARSRAKVAEDALDQSRAF